MSSQDAPPKAFPTLVGKGGKSLGALPPRNKLSRSGGGSNGAEADAGDSMNAGAARPRSVSPRSPSTSTFSSSSTSSSTLLSSSATPASAAAAGGAGAGGASAVAAAKPKPDLRARALMSHKKMQEQFNPKKATCSGPGAPMSDRLTRDELAGRAVACALEHLGPRPTRAEMRVVADMLRLLRCQQAGRGTATAVAVAAATTSSVALKVSDSKKKHKKDKDNNDKKENKKGDDKKEKKKAKKDGKEKEKKEKKKEKKDKKDKKDPKKAALCASSTSSSMAADGETTGPLTVLGGQLVYSEDSWDPDGDGTNSNGVSGGRHGPLATADTLQLKELVQAHLEPALANLRETPAVADAPDRSAHGLPWAYEIHAKTDKGVRDANEDTYLVLEHFNDLYTMKHAPPQIYIGLFDGHSGKDAAEYCRTQLHMWIAQELENAAGSPGADRTGQLEELALGNAFLRADKIFVDKARCLGVKDGSTAMAALLRGDHLIVANCGDSQGMLCRRTAGGGTELLSLCTTQKPSREDEKERVKSAGGTVVWFGTWRVNGRLAVTRSIGDEDLKHIIIPQPEVQVTQLSPDDEFIVLATDGLWDYMTEDEVATFIRTAVQTKPKSEVSNALVEHVVSTKNSKDNVTIIIVFFDHASSSSSSTSSSSSSMAPS